VLAMDEEVTGKARGGVARAAKLTPEERKGIAKKAAEKRWSNKDIDDQNIPKAIYLGELKIGNMIFPCSVLSDGTRILTQSDFMTGMGMYYSGWVSKNRPIEQTADVPHFLNFKTLLSKLPQIGEITLENIAYLD